jgi:hypothetical protein
MVLHGLLQGYLYHYHLFLGVPAASIFGGIRFLFVHQLAGTVALRLVAYGQSVRLGAKSLDDRGQSFIYITTLL